MNTEVSFKGKFYHPDKKIQVAGVLTYRPSAKITLETFDIIIGTEYILEDINYSQPVNIINGLTSCGKDITILYSNIIGYLNNSNGFPLVTYECEYFITGKAFNSIEEIYASTIFLKPQFIDEWVNKYNYNLAYNEGQKSEYTITIESPEPITLCENNDINTYIYFRQSIPFIAKSENKIIQSPYLNIEAKRHCFDLDNIIRWSNIYQAFLSVGISFNIGFIDIGFRTNTSIDCRLYKSNNYINNAYSDYNTNRMIFCLDDIRENSKNLIENWQNTFNKLPLTIEYFFKTNFNYNSSTIKNVFINLVQAIEIYYRWVKCEIQDNPPNQIEQIIAILNKENRQDLLDFLNFRNQKKKWKRKDLKDQIIDSLNDLEPFSSRLLNNKSLFSEKIVHTRHHLNHDLSFDEEKKYLLINEDELGKYIQKLRIIVQGCFLKEMGFTPEEINTFLARPMHNLLNMSEGMNNQNPNTL